MNSKDQGPKAWEPSDSEELTDSVINQIVWEVREARARPRHVRRLLQNFVEKLDHGQIPSQPLLEHLRDAFREYLNNPKRGQLERLLGLVSPRGRPPTSHDVHHQIAWQVLRLRLQGNTLEDAAAEVSKLFDMHESRVQDIWAKHREVAFDFEKWSRGSKDSEGRVHWSDDEKRRLQEIYPEIGCILSRTP